MSLTPHEREEGFDFEGQREYNHRFGDVTQDPGVEMVAARRSPSLSVPRPLLETLLEIALDRFEPAGLDPVCLPRLTAAVREAGDILDSNTKKKEIKMVKFQWPTNPPVQPGMMIADAGCLNQRAYRQNIDAPQTDCKTFEVVKVFSWGLRVKSEITGDEFDVTDWFIPDNAHPDRTADQDCLVEGLVDDKFRLNPDATITKYIRDFKAEGVSEATKAFHTEYHVNAPRTDSFGGADGCDLTPKKGE